ncbi:MAG TPA: hypothetical protein PKW18_12995 [Candidatus Sumerlaeota bacterium]|nr:hypothetical protein [Candidatus Sumerlaeota bacterium]
MIKVNEIVKNEKLREQYQKWTEDPMTQMVVDALRTETRIMTPTPENCKGEIALVLVGENAGAHNILDRMMNLDKIVEQTEELSSDFGASTIFEKQYK